MFEFKGVFDLFLLFFLKKITVSFVCQFSYNKAAIPAFLKRHLKQALIKKGFQKAIRLPSFLSPISIFLILTRINMIGFCYM